TEGQLQTVSKDVASLNDGAVKYWQNEDGSYDKSFVQLEGGEDGTLVTHVRDGAVNEYSSDAVNGSQLYAVQQEAGKHTTVTVNGGVEAPEDGSYTNKDGHLDGNLLLKQTNNDGQIQYDIKLNPDVNLTGEGKDSDNRVWLSGSNGTITATTKNNLPEKTTVINGGNVYVGTSVSVGANDDVVITDKDITGLSNTNWDGTTDNVSRAATEGQLQTVSKDVASLNDGAVKYWQNEDGSYDKSFVQLEGGEDGTLVTHVRDGAVNKYSSDAVNGSQLWETQQQIKDVETTANKHTIVSTTDDSNLTVKNVAKEGEADNYQVTLNDEVVLGDYFDKGNGVLISGNSGTISATNSITVGEDQGLVIDGQKKTIQGLSNTTWTGTTETPNRAATEGQLQNAYDGSVKYWRNEDGTYDKSFIQLEGGEEGTTITHLKDGVVAEYSTEAINGSQLWETQQQIKDVETTANKHTIVSTTKDSNLTVKNVAGEGEADNYQVALKDDITLKGDSSSIELTGTKGTIQVNQETAEGTNFTNINGNVVSIGYTNSEGIENAIVIDGGKGTITGLSNTTWDDELAKQVADSEELQGTAATQGQLQQAVSEVSGIVNKGWTAKAGDNDGEINITPGDTLNFEGDGNITVSATGGTSNELKFGLNDNITLGDKESTSITLYTDPTSETTVVGTDGNTTNVTGYVPESYKSGTGADFVKNNGGFALFTTDTQGHGIFGVTTKGTAHGKDFVTYTKDIYGNDTRYSLNDVGDAVAQMSSYYNGKNSYTVFSRYLNEAEKDNPFVTVDEDGNKINATRDIPLALRDDGAVLIGATIKGEDFTDNGIRINAETETTYDEDGNEVTNNIATITGLENTEWKPPTPVATFAANDGSATVTSRAATESQLNDLYNVVSVYNTFDNNGNVNYNTIKLRGDEYSYNEKNPVDSKGTSITNVAYASGTDGSEAVNVDYLNDAINNAVKDGGAISDSDRHLQEGTYHVNDQGKVELIVADEKGENQSTVTIDNIANKNDITNLDNKIDNTFNDLNDKINNIDNVETDVKGGNINEDGTISLKTENEDGTTTNVTLKGQLTDSGVVQEGTSFDKETGTITITSQDKYSGETSSVKVEGIASTEVVGATNKEDLATAYKDADKDGNATTEYITDSESMVEADVALDHAIQDVAGTSYANDMVLSNRIDSVEKRLGNVEERIDKVGAMAAAIANLRTMGFDPEAPTEIAIGVGQYKSETGIAIGVFHYPNQDFMLSASLSSSGDELMGGIGATWKLGRKSAAERAKDEEARHLEQAEEMKKLAQQEKVKAQAQRHAKLLAERQQASQKNA
uniref:YadA-like family protein n=1 Tax=Megamonas funiformis TaxID=437897 RepID=UPI00241E4BDF